MSRTNLITFSGGALGFLIGISTSNLVLKGFRVDPSTPPKWAEYPLWREDFVLASVGIIATVCLRYIWREMRTYCKDYLS